MTLLVKRIGPGGRCALYVLRRMGGMASHVVEVVTAQTPQLIADYIAAAWPRGTQVQWLMVAKKTQPRKLLWFAQ